MDRTEPGWRLADIESAREQVPEEENSARVVVAAAALLPKQWPPQDVDDLFKSLVPAEQLSPEAYDRFKKELNTVHPALKEARKLAERPRGHHHIAYKRNILETLMNDQGEVRRIWRLLEYDALLHDQDRDMKRALISCRAALNAGRSLGDEPLAISQLIRTAGVVTTCRAVERALAQGEPPPDEMIAIQKLLDDEDAFSDLLIFARGERAADQELFDAFENGDVSMGELAGGRPDWFERLAGFLYRDNVRREHPTMLALMSQFVAIAQLPSWEQAEAERQFEQEARELPKSAILTRLLLPHLTKLGESSRRRHACVRCMTAILATERYRQTHKHWPDSLNQLCPRFLSAVSLDPYDGAPLRYQRANDGVMIYTVGMDRVDDGGNLDFEHITQPGVDIGFRLWDVPKRRQPPRPKPPPQPAPMPPWMQGNTPNPG
jgi:hypothetical protein